MMSGHLLEMSAKTYHSASPGRGKCSRNKRKFRQDPPFSNQEISDLNHKSGNVAGVAAASIEEEKWPPESRSVEAAVGKSSCEDSNQKECEDETNSLHGKSEATKYCHLKLRWFRPGQAKVAQAGGAVVDGDSEHAAEGKVFSDGSEDDENCEPEFVDWTEAEFEGLLVETLGSLYNEAIKKIVASGHGKEKSLNAVLRQGRCSGAKDAVTNIVENSLAYLNGNNQFATDGEDRNFSDLRELQRYSLAEMIEMLREVRPLLSKGEAMWRLLVCDLNIELACDMDDSALLPHSKEPIPSPLANQSGQSKAESISSAPFVTPSDGSLPTTPIALSSIMPSMDPPAAPVLNQSPVAIPSRSKSCPPCTSSTALPPSGSPPPNFSPRSSELAHLSLLDCKHQSSCGGVLTDAYSTFDTPPKDRHRWRVMSRLSVDGCTSRSGKQEEATAESTNVPAISLVEVDDKVDAGERSEDTFDNERRASASVIYDRPSESPSFTARTCPATNRSPKDGEVHDSLDENQLTLNRRSDSKELHRYELQPPDGTVHAVRYPDGISPSRDARGATMSLQEGSNCNEQASSDSVATPCQEAASSSVRFVAIDEPVTTVTAQEESLTASSSDAEGSFPAGGSLMANAGRRQAVASANVVQHCTGDKISTARTGDVEDPKDERIMKLIHRVGELEAQLQERIEWAKQKVMQAARKLTKDLHELKALRHARDEALLVKNDRQASEDHAVKRIAESEDAIRKTRCELDFVNKSKIKLEKEIAELRAEMEAAKLSAAEAQASCRDMEKRERKDTKRAQAWEKQKAKLQEELSEEKKKGLDYKQQCVQSKEREQQAEVRWLQEEKAKEDANRRAEHERRAREQAESAAKKREESLRRKAESNYQRHREDIQRLESEIAQFRTSAEAAQLATSRWGPGVAVIPQMMKLSSSQALNDQLTKELLELQGTERRDVRRERECVMCMSEEISVVFLPCAHQVVCVKCNELHQARDMTNCPSCRTPINQRVRVYGVST